MKKQRSNNKFLKIANHFFLPLFFFIKKFFFYKKKFY